MSLVGKRENVWNLVIRGDPQSLIDRWDQWTAILLHFYYICDFQQRCWFPWLASLPYPFQQFPTPAELFQSSCNGCILGTHLASCGTAGLQQDITAVHRPQTIIAYRFCYVETPRWTRGINEGNSTGYSQEPRSQVRQLEAIAEGSRATRDSSNPRTWHRTGWM